MSFFRSHRGFLLLYGTVFLCFLWPCLFLQKTFIFGDYWQQHYPWAYEYARALKSGVLPYWLPQVANGFPLVAEGQVGAYYLPHLLMYGLLPFFAAYTWGVVLHVLAGGVGSYVYGQKAGLSKEAASVFALLFSFSSAYGGCFSNTAVLRVMAWLPWFLWGWEMLGGASKRKRLYWTIVLGFFFSQMATAGAPQMALYTVVYLFLFCLLKSRGRYAGAFFSAAAIGAVLSLPQWAATLELMPLSARAGETAQFALWGSVLPPSLVSLFFPEWGTFLGLSFYVGAVPVYLILVSLFSPKSRPEKIHLWLALLFASMALGRYNQVYALIVERGPFTALRNPSKWLFFTTVSLSAAAAFAYDRLAALSRDKKFSQGFRRCLFALPAFLACAPFLARTAYRMLERHLSGFARQSAEAAFAGKTDPLHDAAYYRDRAAQMLAQLERLFSYSDPWNLFAIAVFLVSAFVMWRIFADDARGSWKKTALPAVLAADLLVFGTFLGTGFTGNARAYPEELPPQTAAAIRERQDRSLSNAAAWAAGPGPEILPANVNLLYGLNHAGGYSPLLLKRYYDLTKELGIVDSSLGRRAYSEEVWRKEADLVEELGIGQILSDRPLSLPGFRLVSVTDRRGPETRFQPESKQYLYEAEIAAPYARLAGGQARIISKEPLKVSLETESGSDATLVLRSAYYPRWKAVVDGRPAPVIAADHAFSGIFLEKGKHEVLFYYDTAPHRLWEGIALAAFCVLVVCWLRLKKVE